MKINEFTHKHDCVSCPKCGSKISIKRDIYYDDRIEMTVDNENKCNECKWFEEGKNDIGTCYIKTIIGTSMKVIGNSMACYEFLPDNIYTKKYQVSNLKTELL